MALEQLGGSSARRPLFREAIRAALNEELILPREANWLYHFDVRAREANYGLGMEPMPTADPDEIPDTEYFDDLGTPADFRGRVFRRPGVSGRTARSRSPRGQEHDAAARFVASQWSRLRPDPLARMRLAPPSLVQMRCAPIRRRGDPEPSEESEP